LNELDFGNRWVYKGSLTTPPCTETIYWNVLDTVYPIKEQHLNWFKDRLGSRGSAQLKEKGNFRVVQQIKDQDPKYISSDIADS